MSKEQSVKPDLYKSEIANLRATVVDQEWKLWEILKQQTEVGINPSQPSKVCALEARVRELESLIPSNETISSMIQCANDRLRRGFRDDADGCDVIIYCNKVIEWRKKK